MFLAQTSAPSSAPASLSPSSIIEIVSPTPNPVATVDTSAFPAAATAPEGFARFFDPMYYLTPAPFDQNFLLGEPLAVLFLLMLIAAFGLLIWAQFPRIKRRINLKHRAYWLLFFGIAGVIFLYFRADHVPFLGMRLWLALVLVGFVVWGVREIVRALRAR